MKEVEECVKAGIVRLVRYPTWICYPVLVKKVDGTWRMCIDFKNVNLAYPKDYYPLSEIVLNIEAVAFDHLRDALSVIFGLSELKDAARQLLELHMFDLSCMTDPMELEDHVPVYIPEPEHPEDLVPAEDEAPIEATL
ncbi:hypothetical protein Tco_1229388 [Tanacetum coccineum]